MSANLPSGTITFLFTDIEGSTPLWEGEPDQMRLALARHNAILRSAVAEHEGHVFKTIGDAFQAAFALPAQAVAAALAAQRGLAAEKWPTSTPLRVRMGLHVGPAEAVDNDYATTHTLNRVARIMSIGHGSQVLLSVEVADLARGQLPADVTLRDMGRHRLKGLSHLERLFQIVAPDLPADFPVLKSLDALPNNLPTQLTSFVGREKECAEVKQLLAGSRLLTLTGPGGTGKTRLALQVAADVLAHFPDGVWLVELASLSDPALLPQSVATVLGLREAPGRSLLLTLMDYLRAKNLLLLLDNCEHLVEACAHLVQELLRSCPHLRLLASSREVLGITGETMIRVPPLALPDMRHGLSAGSIGHYEAVQLFMERASAVQSHFKLTEQNAPAIAQICHRLDGIPLAIELAAARIRLFSAEQIAQRLDDRFRLLTGGSRTALPRQQTLRALIDWSYDLLSAAECVALRRLSVFAGGWTFEAAEAVVGQDTILADDVLDVLAHLVDKSLVVVDEPDDDGAARYRFLETIRQYARDKLLESGETAGVRDRHLDFFLIFVEEIEPKLPGPAQLRCLDRLEAEHDNVRLALEWGLERNADAALRLAGALYTFWFVRGYTSEGRGWLSRVITQAKALPQPDGEAARSRMAALAKALYGLGALAFNHGDFAAARMAGEESLALARQLGDKRMLAQVLGGLGMAEAGLGNTGAGEAAVQESVALLRAIGDKPSLAMMLTMSAELVAGVRGDFTTARAHLEESLRLSHEIGSPLHAALALLSLGGLAARQEEYAEARLRFAECLALFRQLRDNHHVNMARSGLAHIERRQGNYEQAIPLYRDTIVAWQEMGHRAAVAHELECFAFIAGVQGHARRAARLLGAAEALREAIGIPMSVDERIEYDREVAAIQAQTNPAFFAAAWADGRAMTPEQAVTLALEESRMNEIDH